MRKDQFIKYWIGSSSSWKSYWTRKSLFFLDGTIILVGSDYYFKDNSSAARNFLITGYDFDSTWTKGFPYKSAATISAPSGDAVLIAADINNFLYDSGGTPNAIPVVSLFQNIDYENKIFCKHEVQILDGNGVETYEPRVSEIFMTADTLSTSDLIKANTYFDVPAEVTTNVKWVSKTGNDGTGNGSKALPWLTINKANTSATAGDTVYIKTGNYLESNTGVTGYLMLSKACKFTGIGNIVITSGSTAYGIYVNANDVELEGIGFYETKSQPTLFNNIKTGLIVRRCYIKSPTKDACKLYGGIVINCVIDGYIYGIRKYNCDELLTITNTYCYGRTSIAVSASEVGVNNINCSNSKFIGLSGIAVNKTITANILGCDIRGTGTPLSVSGTGTISIKYCSLEKTNGTGGYIKNVPSGTSKLTIDHCNFTTNYNTIIILNNWTEIYFTNNKVLSSGDGKEIVLQVLCSTEHTYFEITDNIFTCKSDYGNLLTIGDGTVTESGTNLMTGIVNNNTLLGSKYYYPDTTPSQHCLPVFFQDKVKVYNNYIHGCGIGIVFKHHSTDLTSCDCHHNIIVNCATGISSKGGRNLSIYNNTIYNNIFGYHIYILDNLTNEDSDGCVVKNNIIFDNTPLNSSCCYYLIGTSTGLVFEHNLVFSTNNKISNIGDGSLADWQALGYDLNVINSNPLLTDLVNYILTLQALSPAIGAGEDLGATYDDGLDASTDWGTDTDLPVIVPKQQGATWDIGAYIH
jgi:hypothetical protein